MVALTEAIGSEFVVENGAGGVRILSEVSPKALRSVGWVRDDATRRVTEVEGVAVVEVEGKGRGRGRIGVGVKVPAGVRTVDSTTAT